MPTIESLKQGILTECEDDYVGLWSIVRDVEEFFPKMSEADLRDKVISLLYDLLTSKQIQAGIPSDDGSFQSAGVSSKMILDQVRTDWPIGRRPKMGEGYWFTKT